VDDRCQAWAGRTPSSTLSYFCRRRPRVLDVPGSLVFFLSNASAAESPNTLFRSRPANVCVACVRACARRHRKRVGALCYSRPTYGSRVTLTTRKHGEPFPNSMGIDATALWVPAWHGTSRWGDTALVYASTRVFELPSGLCDVALRCDLVGPSRKPSPSPESRVLTGE
jgi:hypothetical protein